MAAHVLTALKQIREDIKQNRLNWSFFVAALMLSCWTEDLELDDYSQLDKIVTAEDKKLLSDWIISTYNKYYNEWFNLGCPKTREAWRKEKYK